MRRTIVVASADPKVREDWAARYEREDAAVIRCAGPLAFCGLKESRSCPLLEGADVAVYDVAAVSPDFLLRLVRSRCRAALVFAHDEADAAGRHGPVYERAFCGGRPRDIESCFGSR